MCDEPTHTKIQDDKLSNMQLQVLDDVRTFLNIPHLIQELLSSDRTLTLPVALPVHERLLSLLVTSKEVLPLLVHGLDDAIAKLQNYLMVERKKPIYSIAIGMILA